MIELGDAIKFAELAWVVIDYGWSRDLNASRQYHEFFQDVEHLGRSLDELTDVIEGARLYFSSRRLEPPSVTFGWDRETLIQIVGDFDATLRECHLLIRTNTTYEATTGPVRNLQWNALVMPSVERLRQRILMHQSKIQHLLQPFKIDLHIRLHDDLAQRISELHNDVRSTRADVRSLLRDMQALKRHFDPSSFVEADQTQYEPTCKTLLVPEAIQSKLEDLYVLHPDRDLNGDWVSSLSDISDAFIRNLEIASPRGELNGTLIEEAEDQKQQYIALMTCQFLITKMLESNELIQASEMSHWPRYVKGLQKQLHNIIATFDEAEIADALVENISPLEVPRIWEEESPAPYIESATLPAAIEHLLELPLVDENPRRWRKIKLSRYCDSTDRHFLLVITAGDNNSRAAETRRIDIDLEHSSLVPRYASPGGQEPLEMVLRVRNEEFRLVFCSRTDLYLFQQALTGYHVMDEYMPYRVQTIFVVGSSGQEIKEYASLQLWQPRRLEHDDTLESRDAVDIGDGVDGHMPFSRRSTITSQGWNAPSSPDRAPLPQRRSSTPASAIRAPHGKDYRNTGIETVPEQPPISSSAPTRSFGFLSRLSNAPTGLSRPQRQDQAPSRTSRSSLSSGSSSSTGTLRRGDQGRQSSFSVQSVTSTATTMSTATVRAVTIGGGGGNTTSIGTLHCKPSEPMLVLFTREVQTGAYGIVALSLDQYIAANYHACECTRMPNCRLTVLEKSNNAGRSVGSLPVLRLGGSQGDKPRWDILSLAESMKSRRSTAGASGTGDRGSRAWQRVIRVTMCFQTAADRTEFAGLPCTCPARSEGELMECLKKFHYGRLGIIKEGYRRRMVEWFERRYRQRVNMLDRPQRLGVGST